MKLREDRDEEARCPFCRGLLEVPENMKTGSGEFIGGRCGCGAVYVCDPTGHNVGEAYLDALTFACGDDWDMFRSLNPGENYDESVFNYDARNHRLSPVKDIRTGHSGKMVFVRVRG